MLTPDSILLIVVASLFGWLAYLNLPLAQAEYVRKKLDEIRSHWQCQKHPTDNRHEPSANQIAERAIYDSLVAQSYAEEHKHRAEEKRFWERQIRVAKWLNGITLFAGIVAVVGLLALIRSVGDAEDATTRANRAWLMADHPGINLRTNADMAETIQAWFEITNIGKEPASDVRTYLRPFWLTPIKQGNYVDMDSQQYRINDTCEYTITGASLGIIWPRSIPYGEHGVVIVADPGFNSGSQYYGFQGCISYYTFSTMRHTRFCEVRLPNGEWNFCQGKGQQWAD